MYTLKRKGSPSKILVFKIYHQSWKSAIFIRAEAIVVLSFYSEPLAFLSKPVTLWDKNSWEEN